MLYFSEFFFFLKNEISMYYVKTSSCFSTVYWGVEYGRVWLSPYCAPFAFMFLYVCRCSFLCDSYSQPPFTQRLSNNIGEWKLYKETLKVIVCTNVVSFGYYEMMAQEAMHQPAVLVIICGCLGSTPHPKFRVAWGCRRGSIFTASSYRAHYVLRDW